MDSLYIQFVVNMTRFVMLVFLDFHRIVCKQCVSNLTHRSSQIFELTVNKNGHMVAVFLPYVLLKPCINTIYYCTSFHDFEVSANNVVLLQLRASAMLLL